MRSLSQEALVDNYSTTRLQMDKLAATTNEYCGLPVPINGETLIVEPSHPASKLYESLGKKDDDPATHINTFYSHAKRCDVVIWREPDGKLDWGLVPALNSIKKSISTAGCSIAWSVDAEIKAMEKLKELIPEHLFKMYFLTGMFIETSKRSGVTYIFRKLRPTIALRPDEKDQMRILTTLCLHPIGYYAETWAGSMCPTDDVLSHLLLMRADEPFFWKRANQIPPHRPEAGL